jgi:hypothetical protein
LADPNLGVPFAEEDLLFQKLFFFGEKTDWAQATSQHYWRWLQEKQLEQACKWGWGRNERKQVKGARISGQSR